MQAVIEKLSGLERRLKVTVEKDHVQKAYQAKLKDVLKNANMKGFRPGKAPAQLVESRYSKAICQEIAGDLMQESFDEAIKQHDLKIAGRPQVDPKPVEPNIEFEYEATFEVYPEIQLKNLEGVALEKTITEIGEKDLDKVVDDIRKRHAIWESVERAAKEGDQVDINFEGFIDDKAFEGGKAEHFKCELGAKQMIPGFEEGIIGKKAGDHFDIQVTFPEKYPVQDLAGKPARFHIDLHEVKEATLPNIDEEFLKKVGFAEKNADDFKAHVKKNMQKDLNQMIENKFKSQVFEKLLELNAIEVPRSLVKNEIHHMQDSTRRQMAMQQGKKDLPAIELPSEPFEKQASRRVSLGLLIGEMIRQHDMKVDDNKVREKLLDMLSDFPEPEKMLDYYYQNEQMLSQVQTMVLEEQAIEKLLENAKINEKSMSYDAFVEWIKQGGDDL